MKSNATKGSIRLRLVLAFAFTTGVVFFANLFLYLNINKSIKKVDEVYVSNVEMNELLVSLKDVQGFVYEYLNTKSTDALENYYRSEQRYYQLINGLKADITNNDLILMQKNIKNMSELYINIVDETVDAKRGRNIERYKENYETATTLFGYISTYINNLNNEQFKLNSNNYEMSLVSFKYLEITSSIILFIIMIFNVILIIFVTRSITGPLTKLTLAANEVAAGNFSIDIAQAETSDEVEILTKAFNTMIESIQQYIKQTKDSMELEARMKERELMMAGNLKDAQLKYLQAQINPHFLFNTLNAGVQLAMLEDADRTCEFIENMAEFFRFNMNSFDKDSTIRDEIKLVDCYIYILNVRFASIIQFYKEVDERVLDVRVPSMILQPIVENAVNYGIRDIDYEGSICLRIYQDDIFIYISISDNGMGMNQKKIERIMKYMIDDIKIANEKEVAEDTNGIGLRNVINRLRLYYNSDNIFEIKSEGKFQGTVVTIKLPKKDSQ